MADIDTSGGDETADLVRAAGAKGAFVATDASDPGQIRDLIARTAEMFGGLDVANLRSTHVEPQCEPHHHSSFCPFFTLLP